MIILVLWFFLVCCLVCEKLWICRMCVFLILLRKILVVCCR